MTLSESVQQYVARQPKLAVRRRFMRDVMIRWFGFRVLAKVEVIGQEQIPDSGPTIIMINHTSLLDPPAAMGAVTNRFIIPMTKVENLRNPLLAPFIWFWGAYSVKRGEVDRKALSNSIELLKSGQAILISPEGTRQRHGLAAPKDGLAFVATKADAVIVPTAIVGTDNYLKKWLTLRRPHITIVFGRPFRFKTEGRARISRDDLSAMSEEAMYQLARAIPDPAQRGLYADLSKATTQHLDFL